MYKENPSKTNKHIRFWGKYLFARKVFLKEKRNIYHGIYLSKIDMIDPMFYYVNIIMKTYCLRNGPG